MRHRFECPVRWADLDPLGHVNNVVYVDYLQEARVDMMRTHALDPRGGDLAEAAVVTRSEVSYLAPLTFRFRPVSIECWVTLVRAASFTVAYEVFDEHEDGTRTTYLRASTALTPYVFAGEHPRRLTPEERVVLERLLEPADAPTPAALAGAPDGRGHHYPLRVRFSDVDVYGHVNNVKYFEFFQEGRVALMAGLRRRLPPGTPHGQVVVARTDVEYRVPLLFRPEPYDLWSRVSHVGTTSMVVEAEIRDRGAVQSRARVVLVFWDRRTQRKSAPPPEVRALLLAEQAATATPGC
ncbi:MAG TPA: thioesterase family protein [Nocardioides sp.]|uniref:acyl-CoA thioesterase n=1 Tax=Nocardioides sp. TaxID=35761 RepID=UPI002C2A1F2E|nr:thioesterase family protein [Nocardioides sp.]HQR25745.1 thioesterase family protein [Nocardioides sp.]